MKRPKLPSGVTGFRNAAGEFVCTGAAMGRRDLIPPDPDTVRKLHLVKLRWVDGDYDEGGAYWGNSGGTAIYWAFGQSDTEKAECFVRAIGRQAAKSTVRDLHFPNASFYR